MASRSVMNRNTDVGGQAGVVYRGGTDKTERTSRREDTDEGLRVHDRLYNILHYTLTPLFMLICIPNISMLVWYGATKCNGSLLTMYHRFQSNGFIYSISNIWINSFSNLTSVLFLVLFIFCLIQVILMKSLPGKICKGPVTPNDHIPVYVDNGLACYGATLVIFGICTAWLKLYGLSPTYVYDHLDGFFLATNIMGHILCTCLLIKGLVAPSTPDNGTSHNLLFDYYWGTDLYPRIFGIDVKVFTNCRFGMTIWPLFCIIFAMKNYEVHGFVDSVWLSTVLQIIYITNFFIWEAGYYRSIDIIMDRAGYMICWGCICYVPSVYASVSLYLASNPVTLGPTATAAIFMAGASSIGVNYWADYQRQVVRATDGKCEIWGKTPVVIRATYSLNNGEEKSNLLLVSGFWGLARHFNYLPEILLAFFWSLPALFSNFLVYFYAVYLTILLTHRAFRDDAKCRKKYGKHWEEYCKIVPYKIIPGLF